MNRTRAFLIAFTFAASALFLPSPQIGAAKMVLYKVGLMNRHYTPPEPYDWRGAKTHALVTDIWYPADPAAVEQMQWIGTADAPFAKAAKAARDAAPIATPEKFPLILLSHGIGGSSSMSGGRSPAMASVSKGGFGSIGGRVGGGIGG